MQLSVIINYKRWTYLLGWKPLQGQFFFLKCVEDGRGVKLDPFLSSLHSSPPLPSHLNGFYGSKESRWQCPVCQAKMAPHKPMGDVMEDWPGVCTASNLVFPVVLCARGFKTKQCIHTMYSKQCCLHLEKWGNSNWKPKTGCVNWASGCVGKKLEKGRSSATSSSPNQSTF